MARLLGQAVKQDVERPLALEELGQVVTGGVDAVVGDAILGKVVRPDFFRTATRRHLRHNKRNTCFGTTDLKHQRHGLFFPISQGSPNFRRQST